ncbi:MAG: serine hydrolase domain-containing protein [Acidimicrobiales bacterium]
MTTATTALLDAARRDVESGWLPACQIAVARDGELVVFETFGDATDDDRFLAFSTTKPIVASLVWQLIGEGLLDVDLPVAHYVPEFAANGKGAVTVEQVLLHTAGFPEAPMGPVEGADGARRLERLASWRLDWEPGTRFEYHAGSAHWVLVELIERLGGGDFRDLLEQRVCAPLGLPRVLGLPVDRQQHIAAPVPVGDAIGGPPLHATELAAPDVIAAGVPGGGAVLTAADLAMFYQGLLHDPDGIWRPDVLADATGNIRCTLPEPLFGLPVNRSIGLVVAGDDGNHVMRYAAFGQSCSPRSFGHAGMHMQVAWADPDTGISFAYLTNGADADVMREGARGVRLSDLAAQL